MKTGRNLRNTLLGLGVAYALGGPISSYAQGNSYDLVDLACKNITELTPEERGTLVEKLRFVESSNNPNAVNIVLKKNKKGEVVDTIRSVGIDQINVSKGGSLEDYNNHHKKDCTRDDMFSPEKSGIVRNWYLFKRIPQILGSIGVKPTTANSMASYNTGVGTVEKIGGDVMAYFFRLSKITQGYLVKFFGKELFQ